jgi:hypothetical protein
MFFQSATIRYEYLMRTTRFFVSLAALFVLTGCASVRESVQWEFNSENVELAPHEERRAVSDHLSDR